MELIKGITSTIKASFPDSASDFTAKVYNEAGTQVGNALVPVSVEGKPLTVEVPHSVVVEEGKYRLAIGYKVDSADYNRNIYFHVATPYLDFWELREIMTEEEGFTDAEVWEVETAARNIINVYCGQEFGYASKTIKFIGEDGSALSLPERIIKINKVSEGSFVKFDRDTESGSTFLGDGQFVVTGDGFFLKRPRWSSDAWEEWGTLNAGNVITAPGRVNSGRYHNDVEYTLEGIFGYEEVPGPVKEAMKLLVNDYACAEQLYRDRFLESMKAADWRLQFNSGAYRKTGNARANLLLAPYVINRMKVI